MSHLSPAEFVDLADGTLADHRAAHAEGCEACRAQAASVRDALQLAGATTTVPEPSPLFWDQLSARVREAVAEPPRRSVFGFGFRGLQPVAAALLAAVVVAGAVFLTRSPRQEPPSRAAHSSTSPAGDADHAPLPTLDPAHAAEWAVLTAAAADLHFDEARDAGMAVPSATVDNAVTQLTHAELSELGRLLQSELKGSSD